MRTSRRATIADVAAASGLGVGTVSRVINGAGNVRDATRVSVLKVIEQLGYRPSHLAAALSRGTTRTVAIVVPQLTRPSAVMRLAGALAVLDGQGYDTVVYNVDTPQQRDLRPQAGAARPARPGERRGAGRGPARAAGPAVGHLRGVGHPGHGSARRGGPVRHRRS